MKLKFVLIPLILISLIGCSSKSEKPKKAQSLSESINLDVHEIKLDNGMTALVYPNHRLPIFSVYLYYKVGGKNERPGITGASHFLEHMMFKGAKKYGQGKIDFMIEGSGGSTNAYTTNDQTVYYENLPTTELESILDIEADRLENLLLDKEAFEKERAVVLEERKMRYENSPRGQLYLGLMKNLYKGTPYGSSVIGEIPDLKSVTREQIHEYLKNSTLLITSLWFWWEMWIRKKRKKLSGKNLAPSRPRLKWKKPINLLRMRTLSLSLSLIRLWP